MVHLHTFTDTSYKPMLMLNILEIRILHMQCAATCIPACLGSSSSGSSQPSA
jgi:hypothetical protein